MSKNKRSTMSDPLKYEIAQELGVIESVKNNGWGAQTSRTCGNMVKKAIEIANKTVSQ